MESNSEWRAVRFDIAEGRRIDEKRVLLVLLRLMEVLNQENNVIMARTPCIVVGDIHGQLDDMLHMFRTAGNIGTDQHAKLSDEFRKTGESYVFMGDYVDRGYHSLNTFLYVATLKIDFPNDVWLLRGNHESRQVSQRYGLYYEILLIYGHVGLWTLCNEVFDLLPLAALVGNEIFCVHGGLSPEIPMIEHISGLDRQQELPQMGAMADLCWSDPENVSAWRANTRGAGFLFGMREAKMFTRINKLRFVCRSHQLAENGWMPFFGDDDGNGRPFRVVTVWSAPNYSYRSGNKATFMRLDGGNKPNFVEFDPAPDAERITPAEEERPVGQYFQ